MYVFSSSFNFTLAGVLHFFRQTRGVGADWKGKAKSQTSGYREDEKIKKIIGKREGL